MDDTLCLVTRQGDFLCERDAVIGHYPCHHLSLHALSFHEKSDCDILVAVIMRATDDVNSGRSESVQCDP